MLALAGGLEGDTHGVRDEGEVMAMMQGPDDLSGRRAAGEPNRVTSHRKLGSNGMRDGFLGAATTAVPQVDGQFGTRSGAASCSM